MEIRKQTRDTGVRNTTLNKYLEEGEIIVIETDMKKLRTKISK